MPFLLEGFADQRELFQSDGIHPNEQAQPLILDTVWKGLRPLLAAAPAAVGGATMLTFKLVSPTTPGFR